MDTMLSHMLSRISPRGCALSVYNLKYPQTSEYAPPASNSAIVLQLTGNFYMFTILVLRRSRESELG